MYSYLGEHKLLLNAQLGFKKIHYTATCILKLLNAIYNNIENGRLTGVVFLDPRTYLTQ